MAKNRKIEKLSVKEAESIRMPDELISPERESVLKEQSGSEKSSLKSYSILVDYVKNQILQGHVRAGEKLPTERELAEKLSISRNSVREGLRVLQNIGVIRPTQGSGNYISEDFNSTISEVLSFLYFLEGDERSGRDRISMDD